MKEPDCGEDRLDFVLHVGLPKTGTTSLQRNLVAKHSGIYYLGKRSCFRAIKGCSSPQILQLLHPLLWDHSIPFDQAASRQLWSQLRQEFGGLKTPVASWESLSKQSMEDFQESLRRIIATFGACRLIICLRNPMRLIPSLYLQHLRNIRYSPHPSKRINWYLEFDQWMELQSEQGFLQNQLAYGDRIRLASESLGVKNICVLLFEDLCEDQDQFTRMVCRFMEVNAEEGVKWMRLPSENLRLTEGQLRFLKEVERSALRRFLMNRMSFKRQIRILESHGRDGVPAALPSSAGFSQAVADQTREGNRWLAETFQLPLEKYNYPM
jgi:hypothetical protein